MSSVIPTLFDVNQWGRILQNANEKSKEGQGTLIVSENAFHFKIIDPLTHVEMKMSLLNVIEISKEMISNIAKEVDHTARNEIGKGLVHLETQVRQLVDEQGLRRKNYFTEILDFYEQSTSLKERIEETPESLKKKESQTIASKSTLNESDIEQVRLLMKENKKLLFDLSEYHESFFDFAVEKCSKEHLLPLLTDVLIEIEKLEPGQIHALKYFLFRRRDTHDSFFELVMNGQQANIIFDFLLKVVTDDELNFDQAKKLQVLKYAHTKKRYDYIFLKFEDLTDRIVKKASECFNTTRISFKTSIWREKRTFTHYSTWLTERSQSSTTLSCNNLCAYESLNRWKKAEAMRSQFVEEHKGTDKPFKWWFIQQMHYAMCNGEDGINTPGQSRKSLVRTSGGWSHFYCPEDFLQENLKTFMVWLNAGLVDCDAGKINPIIFASLVYQRLVSFHPFENGNGRISRLVMDYVLERYNIPPPLLGEDVLDAVFPLDPLKRNQENFLYKIMDGIEKSKQMLID
jgi:hypothetical protein